MNPNLWNERELERALLYLEDQDAGFAIAEVNEATLQRRAVDHFLERLPAGECGVIDLKALPPDTRPAAFIRKTLANAPATRAFFILNLHAAAGDGPEAREGMARELNFSRDVLARLDRLLFFFFPTWFVNLVIQHAKDFFDFVPVVFSLKTEETRRANVKFDGQGSVVVSGDHNVISINYYETQAPTKVEDLAETFRKASQATPSDKNSIGIRISFLMETMASNELSEEEKAKLHENLGDCYSQLWQYESALAHYRKARAKTGDMRNSAYIDLKKGLIYTTLGRFHEAIELFDRSLDVYENLEGSKSRAVVLGFIAGVLVSKGEVDEALKLHHERLEIFDALGNRRLRAVTMGDIAGILTNKGEVDEALKLHREEMEVYEALGDWRSKAVTMGNIARILKNKGVVNEALKLHYEGMEVYEALGDRRSKAVTMGNIAYILNKQGIVEEALKFHQEEMEVYEALGDRRSKAVTMGDIARILKNKGEVDEALKIHTERMEVFEVLGDRRSKAVTMGDIAYILEDKGEVDEALKFHTERLEVFEALGDRRERAVTLWDIGNIQKNRGDRQSALQHIGESYQILAQLGDADGLSVIGEAYGQMLMEDGDTENGMAVLQSSRDVYLKLGQPDNAREVERIIAQFSK